MAKKKDDQWREPGSWLEGCGWEGFGCLFEILLSGIGCVVPTLLVVACVVGYGARTKPVSQFGNQLVARVQRLRQRPSKRVRLGAIAGLNSRLVA